MRSLFDWLLVLFSVIWVSLAIRGLTKEGRYEQRFHWIVWAAGFLIVSGALGFFGSGLAANGVLKVSPSIEWPAGYVRGVVQSSDGTYVVPLEPTGRIQLYDSQWKFLRGWQVDAEGGGFKVVIPAPTLVDVYTARGRIHYTYTFAGELESAREYSDPFDNVPHGRSMIVPTFLWMWPFSSPPLLYGHGGSRIVACKSEEEDSVGTDGVRA
jgi:hypothetical protein